MHSPVSPVHELVTAESSKGGYDAHGALQLSGPRGWLEDITLLIKIGYPGFDHSHARFKNVPCGGY